jgi:hypothetical protein
MIKIIVLLLMIGCVGGEDRLYSQEQVEEDIPSPHSVIVLNLGHQRSLK